MGEGARVPTKLPVARHAGFCLECRHLILVGDGLRWSSRFGRWVHMWCPTEPDDVAKREPKGRAS